MLTSQQIDQILKLCPQFEASEDYQRKNPAQKIDWGDSETEEIQKLEEIISALLELDILPLELDATSKEGINTFRVSAREKLGFAIAREGESWETIAQRLLDIAAQKTKDCQKYYDQIHDAEDYADSIDETLHTALNDVLTLRKQIRGLPRWLSNPYLPPRLNPPLPE